MYCMICGKKSDYGICPSCEKDEKKINAQLRELNKKDRWFSNVKFASQDVKPKLAYFPKEVLKMALHIMEQEKKAKTCLQFGVFATFHYGQNQIATVHTEINDFRLNKYQQKMLTLSVAKHFEEQAEIEK